MSVNKLYVVVSFNWRAKFILIDLAVNITIQFGRKLENIAKLRVLMETHIIGRLKFTGYITNLVNNSRDEAISAKQKTKTIGSLDNCMIVFVDCKLC